MEKIIKPTISVVMPVYNAESYLSLAIDSILKQTFTNFELIIINDGSTDDSLKIIKKYIKIDNRIKLINNEINKGLIPTLNIGLGCANGEYIARMDADDICVLDRFKFQVEYLNSHPDIFLIAGSFYIIDEHGKILRKKQKEYNDDQIKVTLLKSGIIHHPTVMFRNKNGVFYREKLTNGEDRDLWLRFISEGKKLYISSKIVLYYRIHEKSISSNTALTQKAYIKKVVEWYNQRQNTGKDDYDSFDPKTLIKVEGNSVEINKKRQIKLLFLSDYNSKVVRDEIKLYWVSMGLLSWCLSYVLYFICSLPEPLSYLIREKIRKLWE